MPPARQHWADVRQERQRDHIGGTRSCRTPRRVVARGGRLSDLPALVPGLQRRRDRRHTRHHQPARLPGRTRRRRAVAVTGLLFAAGRQRLRHQRLHRRRPAVRHPGRPGRADRPGPRPRDQADHGPGRQPHLRPARLVRRIPRPGLRQAGLVLLASGPAGVRAGDAGRRAGRQPRRVRALRLDLRPAQRRVLPRHLQPGPARPQLGEPGGPPGRPHHDALVDRPRRGRLPDGRHQPDLEAGGAHLGRADRGRAERHVADRERPPAGRVPRRDEPRGRPGRTEPADRRGDTRGHHRGGATDHRPRAPRAEHGVHLRARQPRPGRLEQVGPGRPGAAGAEGQPGAVAVRAGRGGLELALLRQPRPAPRRVPFRRRLGRAPGELGQDARHRAASPQGDAVRVPGRGVRDDQRPAHRDRALPRCGVSELPHARARHRHPGGRGAPLTDQEEPRPRPHPRPVGRHPLCRLHRRCAVDAGQSQLPRDQRRGRAPRPRIGVRPLPAADPAAARR